MFAAELYYDIYLLFISTITFVYANKYLHLQHIPDNASNKQNYNGVYFLTLMMIIFIGLRPISDVFADMPGYAYAMIDGRFEGRPIRWDTNYVFQPMMAFLSSHGASQQTPIIILAVINFGCTLIATKKLFSNDTMLAMLVFFGAFSTFGAATNGLKAGCAAALFLCALAYKDNIFISGLFLFLSLGFHHSMQLPIMAFILCHFYKNTNIYYAFWIICLLLSVLHVTYFMQLFSGYTDEHGSNYLQTLSDSIYTNFEGKTGFRYDFIIYSSIPILIGYLVKRKYKLSDYYTFIYNIYLVTNGIWMLCMYAEFTNRIAYLSWSLYPILIIYPFLKEENMKNNPKTLYCVVIGHLVFTLAMHIIYYNIE